MKGDSKTREQLLNEMEKLNAKIAELEKSESEHLQAEKTLKESEARYKGIIKNAASCIAIYKPIDDGQNFIFVDFNPMAEKIDQISKKEVIGKKVTKVFPGIVKFGLFKVFQNVWKTGKSELFPVTIYQDNRIRGYRENYVYKLSSGEIIAVYTDATERKQAEEALKESENRLNILFEFAPDAYYLSDLKGTFIDGNKSAEELLGYRKEELIGKSFLKLKILSVKELPRAAKLLAENLRGKGTGPDEFTLNCKDGSQTPVEIRTFPVKIKDRTIVLGIARDITERLSAEQAGKQAEETIRQSESTLKAIFNSTGDGLLVVDSHGKVTHRNAKFNKMWQIPSKLINTTDDNILIDFVLNQLSEPKQFLAKVKELYKSTESDRDILHFKDGRVFERTSYPLLAENIVRGRVWCFHDVTHRVKAESALKESEDRLKFLSSATFEGIVLHKKGVVKDANESFFKITGYKREEVIGENLLDYIPYLKDKAKIMLNIVKGYAKPYTITVRRKNGSEFIAELEAKNVKQAGKIIRIAAVRDVTERKKAEQALKESEAKYRMMVESSRDAIVISQNDKFIFFNDAFAEMLGYDKDELESLNYEDIYTGQAVEKLYERSRRRDDGEDVPDRYETLFKRKDGSEIDVEANVTIIDYKGQKGTFAVIRDITKQKEIIKTLKKSAEQTRGLKELIPICAGCNKIRDDEKEGKPWISPAEYISVRLPDIHFTHGMCPDCMKKWYPDYVDKIK